MALEEMGSTVMVSLAVQYRFASYNHAEVAKNL